MLDIQPYLNARRHAESAPIRYDPAFVDRIKEIYPSAKHIHEALDANNPSAIRSLRIYYHTRKKTIAAAEQTLGCPDLCKALVNDRERFQVELCFMVQAQEQATRYFAEATRKFGYDLRVNPS